MKIRMRITPANGPTPSMIDMLKTIARMRVAYHLSLKRNQAGFPVSFIVADQTEYFALLKRVSDGGTKYVAPRIASLLVCVFDIPREYAETTAVHLSDVETYMHQQIRMASEEYYKEIDETIKKERREKQEKQTYQQVARTLATQWNSSLTPIPFSTKPNPVSEPRVDEETALLFRNLQIKRIRKTILETRIYETELEINYQNKQRQITGFISQNASYAGLESDVQKYNLVNTPSLNQDKQLEQLSGTLDDVKITPDLGIVMEADNRDPLLPENYFDEPVVPNRVVESLSRIQMNAEDDEEEFYLVV